MTNRIVQTVRHAANNFVPTALKSSPMYQSLRKLILSHDQIYDLDYYATDVEAAAVQSAGPISSSLINLFKPNAVVDVGCGTGALLAAFAARGCDVAGLEYSDAGLKYCRERGLDVVKFDIEKDDSSHLFIGKTFELATSLEVAEHLPAAIAGRYVGLLCKLSPTIVISAAKPGQGGTDHVNEQPPSYWISKFAGCGYLHDRESSATLARQWREKDVAAFYHENLMVFVSSKRK